MNRRLAAVLLVAAAALGGCGKMGSLEQPAPLYGAQAKADYDAKQRAAADARARAKAAADNGEPDTPNTGPNDPPLTQAPYTAPVGLNNPGAPPMQGALPNPGTAPD